MAMTSGPTSAAEGERGSVEIGTGELDIGSRYAKLDGSTIPYSSPLSEPGTPNSTRETSIRSAPAPQNVSKLSTNGRSPRLHHPTPLVPSTFPRNQPCTPNRGAVDLPLFVASVTSPPSHIKSEVHTTGALSPNGSGPSRIVDRLSPSPYDSATQRTRFFDHEPEGATQSSFRPPASSSYYYRPLTPSASSPPPPSPIPGQLLPAFSPGASFSRTQGDRASPEWSSHGDPPALSQERASSRFSKGKQPARGEFQSQEDEISLGLLRDDTGEAFPSPFLVPAITVSPIKGRRLKLPRASTPVGHAENGESSSISASVNSPHRQAGFAMSRLTKQWLDSSIPSTPIDENAPQMLPLHNMVNYMSAEEQEEERQARKRRRLAAFESGSFVGAKRSPLRPAEIVGMGRMAVNPKDFTEIQLPPKKKKKKGKGGARRPVKRLTLYGLEVKVESTGARASRAAKVAAPGDDDFPIDLDPIWPDAEYPWCLKDAERRELEDETERERRMCVERFFDRETDGEDDELVAEPVEFTMWEHSSEEDGDRATDRSASNPAPRRYLFSSDPSDARAALLSKRQVQAILYRSLRQQDGMPSEGVDDGELACVCGEEDDGRPMVRCDGCLTWYHQACMGITDESQLGSEWFCGKCTADSVADTEGLIGREPTFAPSSNTPRPRLDDAIHLYQPISQSPLIPPGAPAALYRTPLSLSNRSMRTRGGIFRSGDSVGPYTTRLFTPNPLSSAFHPSFLTPKYYEYGSHSDVVERRSVTPQAPRATAEFGGALGAAHGSGSTSITTTPKRTGRNTSRDAPLTPTNRSSVGYITRLSYSGRPGLAFSSGTTVDSGGPSSPTNHANNAEMGGRGDGVAGRLHKQRRSGDDRRRARSFPILPSQADSPLQKYPLSTEYIEGAQLSAAAVPRVRSDRGTSAHIVGD
ncbi:hypothetical protein BOTBODRAFT_185798 [Botryobasidium botryosum FD-172 SS1]|uniref:PHD-type domain-containing protein n=1 Tax=Botryobasidium botryosum (strain FD-172 SS1) TaxID=930990 RepID=A0A067MSL8_BOTB1|nr:hypothetical protein BOTBODRAFT_185798 [Botryobasidium botryosum FD-172 SS1]